MSFMDSELFKWLVLPLLIMLARVIDVSIGTIRIVFVSRGHKVIAPILGFFEVLIWLLAIGQIIRNLSNFMCYIAYGTGFALGTYMGLLIEEKLALGVLLVRIITQRDAGELIQALRQANFGVTTVPAYGTNGKVDVIFTVIKRSAIDGVLQIINRFNPQAFYSIENVKAVREGIFPDEVVDGSKLNLFRRFRKGK
jgi:uncharacterized protein YebE (UPF0316 family)